MNDAGYTLVETLAALLIVGLAMSGLAAGVQVLARQQRGTVAAMADTQALVEARIGLQALLGGSGPFSSTAPTRFAGDPTGFRFECGEPQPCAAQLTDETEPRLRLVAGGRERLTPLRLKAPVRFRYEGALGPSDSWPPARPDRQVLRSISLVGPDDEIPLAKAKVWVEQAAACQFDVILQDCR